MSSVSHPCIAVVDRIVVISSLFSSLSHFSGPVLMFFHYTLAFCCIVCIKHLGNSHCEALVAMGHEVRYTSFVYFHRFGNGMTAWHLIHRAYCRTGTPRYPAYLLSVKKLSLVSDFISTLSFILLVSFDRVILQDLRLVLVIVSKRGLGKRLFVVCLHGNLMLSVLGLHCLHIKIASSSSKITLVFAHLQPRVGRCHVHYRQLNYGLSHWFSKGLLSLPMPYLEFLSSCLLIVPSFLDTTWHWWHMRLLSIVLLIVLPLLFCLSLASLLVILLSYQCHCRCVVNLPLNGSCNEGMIFWCFGLVIICWHVVGCSMYQYIVADNNYSLLIISIDQHVMSQNECSH